MSIRFIGLDGEMTSSELANGGALIQLGLAVFDDEGALKSFSVDINPYFDGRFVDWNFTSAAVHGISKAQVESFNPPWMADSMIADWLISIGAKTNKRMNTVPVGFNVGAFDMPFVQDMLPKTFAYLSRRTVDLNALLFVLDGKVDGGMPVKFETWKKRAKDYAIEKIGYENQHDAGWDAIMHLYAYKYLVDQMTGVSANG